jgi:23S rRNA (cytosine1962-C5)-methyltransferase
MAFLVKLPPCVLHEDEHLLVVNKPPGLNTHAPSPLAGEGIYEWLKNREPRWAKLAIIHRLDKATSGVLVFGKTPLANRSLTGQFTRREVRKTYVFLTPSKPRKEFIKIQSNLVRKGEKYEAASRSGQGEFAETEFRYVRAEGKWHWIQAHPLTGRTHQIRAHAHAAGIPILGDALYGGADFRRVCLHAQEIRLKHPATSAETVYQCEPDFVEGSAGQIRAGLIEPELTNAFRLLQGGSEGSSGLVVERWSDMLLSEGECPLAEEQMEALRALSEKLGSRGVYHKILDRNVRKSELHSAAPKWVEGEKAPETFHIRENGVHFEISFDQGYSVGLFLDQRDNRRRLLTGHIAAGFELFEGGLQGKEVLNTFAYTCAFSVCAALAGARVTSLDLSRKYLDWGKRNCLLNGINPGEHDFIYGDVFDWARRLSKKNRQFDLIILDPPTFSQSKAAGIFRAEKDYPRLIQAVLPLLKRPGILFASSNAFKWDPPEFLAQIRAAIESGGREIEQFHYSPQPIDFPISREEPAYLKTAWFALR